VSSESWYFINGSTKWNCFQPLSLSQPILNLPVLRKFGYLWKQGYFPQELCHELCHGTRSLFSSSKDVDSMTIISRVVSLGRPKWMLSVIVWRPTVELIRVTFNRWRTVVSATWKYADPRLNMSHEGPARVWHVQPRVGIFPCRTNDCVSYILSSGHLQESWIIWKWKSFSPLYLHDINTQDRRVIFSESKTLCDFGHKNSFKEE